MTLYNEEIQRLMYQAKANLPGDFPLVTIEEEEAGYIIIDVNLKVFESHPAGGLRTVEEKLDIAVKLTELCSRVKETGIGCVIQKH